MAISADRRLKINNSFRPPRILGVWECETATTFPTLILTPEEAPSMGLALTLQFLPDVGALSGATQGCPRLPKLHK